MAKTRATAPPKDYESALTELEAIINEMESGQLPLEASLTAYKRGAKVYSCASCADCTAGYEAAYVACQGATGSCAKLGACCSTINANYKPSCQSAVSSYTGQYFGEVSCKSVYDSYKQQGLCP